MGLTLAEVQGRDYLKVTKVRVLFYRKVFFHECYEVLKMLLVSCACQDSKESVGSHGGNADTEEETWHPILGQYVESICRKVLEVK